MKERGLKEERGQNYFSEPFLKGKKVYKHTYKGKKGKKGRSETRSSMQSGIKDGKKSAASAATAGGLNLAGNELKDNSDACWCP